MEPGRTYSPKMPEQTDSPKQPEQRILTFATHVVDEKELPNLENMPSERIAELNKDGWVVKQITSTMGKVSAKKETLFITILLEKS